MEIHPIVTFAYFFPMRSYLSLNEEDIIRVSSDNKIQFALRREYDTVENEFRGVNNYHYICYSCLAVTNSDWKTSDFKVYDSKEIPVFIEEEMYQHIKNHQTLGEYGIAIYKKMEKK